MNEKTIADALHAAREGARVLDAAVEPINRNVDQLESSLADRDKSLNRDFTAARLRSPRLAMTSRPARIKPLPICTNCRCARATWTRIGITGAARCSSTACWVHRQR